MVWVQRVVRDLPRCSFGCGALGEAGAMRCGTAGDFASAFWASRWPMAAGLQSVDTYRGGAVGSGAVAELSVVVASPAKHAVVGEQRAAMFASGQCLFGV